MSLTKLMQHNPGQTSRSSLDISYLPINTANACRVTSYWAINTMSTCAGKGILIPSLPQGKVVTRAQVALGEPGYISAETYTAPVPPNHNSIRPPSVSLCSVENHYRDASSQSGVVAGVGGPASICGLRELAARSIQITVNVILAVIAGVSLIRFSNV